MPKIRRAHLPQAVLDHLVERADQRKIGIRQIGDLLRWLDANPTVPEGKWFKRFGDLVLCGDGELVKTFLLPSQSVVGKEVL
jgi:hypothetical protein